MRRTITLLATTLVVAAAMTGSASAAALYTNSAHTSLVPVGPTLIGASGYNFFYRGGSPFVTCSGAIMALKLTQNSGGVVKFAINTRGFSACNTPWGAAPSGTVQISGSPITVGSNQAWRTTTMTGAVGSGAGFTEIENLVSATGNPPVNGVYAQQPSSGASPVSIMLNNAPAINGSFFINGTENGSYTLASTAAGYSLG